MIIVAAFSSEVLLAVFTWEARRSCWAPIWSERLVSGLGLFVSGAVPAPKGSWTRLAGRTLTVSPAAPTSSSALRSAPISAQPRFLIFRDSELLWIGYLLNTEAAGYYKIAYSSSGFCQSPPTLSS